jgi:multidrug efflux pump subunit AcrA (membrane-fusion protein)
MRVALKPLLVGTTLASTLLIAACGQSAPSAAPAAAPTAAPAAPVAADTARRAPIQQSLAYSGDIRAREQVSVLPKSTGRIERLAVDVGSRVKAGDVLATLDQDSAQLQVLQARAALVGAGLVEDLRINWVWMPPWGPEKITEEGREQLRALGFRV